ncbi:MAG: 16S rRNA (guanine(966)-N(2))-methyltransferase RsmD [Proteobacteria bacterium]|nr:16S rRNA (guanine(966)-N(2))-methyltransferase RsmD [Pseudomonadota bacterium]MBU1612124.1 16S rRNA (guanine(966)-N(2))-methyltransferase RsmD [Pseudomonadota bacterium]
MRIASGIYGGRSIKTCEGPGYRPATGKVRQAVFSMLEARGLTWEGARVLDVFAGSGSLAIEALSRGADTAWFLEMAAKAARLIRENLNSLGVPPGRHKVLPKDALTVLRRPPDLPFDLVFVDPPYGKDLFLPALTALLEHSWLGQGAFVLAEVEAELKLDTKVLPPTLELLTDRMYGQTRILLWKKV